MCSSQMQVTSTLNGLPSSLNECSALERAFGGDNLFLCQLLRAAREGHLCLKAIGEIPHSNAIHRDGDRIYLKRHFAAETHVVEGIKRLLAPIKPIDSPKIEGLLPAQQLAIDHACSLRLSLITGGPGTGKSFTAKKLIETLPLNIAIAAPTGKAASHFVGAKTLHALLREKLSYDLILVDEASMIDVDLMARLFDKVGDQTRLILMGDASQLPPVESGGLFADMIQALPSITTTLTRSLRAETSDLIDLAESVRKGSLDLISDYIINADPIDYARRHPEAHILTPLRYEVERINQALSHKEPLINSLDSDRASSSPATPGVCEARTWASRAEQTHGVVGGEGVRDGSRRVNQRFHKQPMPIMITKNDYTLELFNGQVGMLEGDQAYFGERVIDAHLLPPFQPAYCLSVHKSQGSEFDHVLFVAPPGSERFGREVLYTAITRAKKRLHIIASPEILKAMIEKQEKRLSGLIDRLKEPLRFLK